MLLNGFFSNRFLEDLKSLLQEVLPLIKLSILTWKVFNFLH